MNILVIHPGHAVSTADVYDGVCAGLRGAGANVIPFDWQQVMKVFTSLVIGATKGGALENSQMENMHKFCSFIASADVTNIAILDDIDAVVVVNGLLFPPQRVEPLRKLGIPVVCVGTESPYFDDAERILAPFYSHWFTNERKSVEHFRQFNPNSHYLPMAWNPETHRPPAPDPDRAVDVVFVGGGFPERKALLYGDRPKYKKKIRGGVNWEGISHAVLGTLWNLDIAKELGINDFLRGARYAEGAVANADTAIWHRSAKIALNMHRRMTYVERSTTVAAGAAESLGPRAYEIPAVGGFQLIDDERPEARDIFGDSLATFTAWDSADLERQIRYWLTHPDERERRQQAQHEAIQAHSWTQRATTILETIL